MARVRLTCTNGGLEKWSDSQETGPPVVESVGRGNARDAAKIATLWAAGCIYCQSTQPGRSKEHVIPYALGGKLVIQRGSCAVCADITKRFEDRALSLEMANVRKQLGYPSRSKHSRAAPVSVRLRKGDEVVQVEVPIDEVPLLLTFPLFAPPGMLGEPRGTGLEPTGRVSARFGPSPRDFLEGRGFDEMESDGTLDPIAFARLIAKIGYGMAWSQQLYAAVPSMGRLANALINSPEEIGEFVGNTSDRNIAPEGVEVRAGRLRRYGDVLCSEVQLFARVGMPIYTVALGVPDMSRPQVRTLVESVRAIADEP